MERYGHLIGNNSRVPNVEDKRLWTPHGQRQSEPDAKSLHFIDAAEFLAMEFPVEWLVDKMIATGQPLMIGGPDKSLKTTTAMDLAIAIATGSKFLFEFETVQGNVGFISAESGRSKLQSTLRAQLEARGMSPDDVCDRLFVNTEIPDMTDPAFIRELRGYIEDKTMRLLVVDPTYMAMPVDGKETSIFGMSGYLKPISQICQDLDCTVGLVHHFRKIGDRDRFSVPQRDWLAYAGWAAFMRQWLLLNVREAYQDDGIHRLWLRYGGSESQAGTYAMTVDEGTVDARNWSVDLKFAAAAIDEAQADRQRRQQEAKTEREQNTLNIRRAKIINTLTQYQPIHESKLRQYSGLSSTNFAAPFAELLKEQAIEERGQIKAGNHKVVAIYQVKGHTSDTEDSQ